MFLFKVLNFKVVVPCSFSLCAYLAIALSVPVVSLLAENDPFLPQDNIKETDTKISSRVFQMNRQYPPFSEKEIAQVLDQEYIQFGNGHPAQEALLMRLFSYNGVSFEKVAGSYIWIVFPLTNEHGSPAGKRALVVVNQTPENLDRIEKVINDYENAFSDYRDSLMSEDEDSLSKRKDALSRIHRIFPNWLNR